MTYYYDDGETLTVGTRDAGALGQVAFRSSGVGAGVAVDKNPAPHRARVTMLLCLWSDSLHGEPQARTSRFNAFKNSRVNFYRDFARRFVLLVCRHRSNALRAVSIRFVKTPSRHTVRRSTAVGRSYRHSAGICRLFVRRLHSLTELIPEHVLRCRGS